MGRRAGSDDVADRLTVGESGSVTVKGCGGVEALTKMVVLGIREMAGGILDGLDGTR